MVEGNVGLAFGLAVAAGLSTSLGASLAFCVRVSNLRVLSCALGISAGVMLYVSFVEIFSTKSVHGFQSAGYTEKEAYRYATLTFFGGMVFTWVLDKMVHGVMYISDHINKRHHATIAENNNKSADGGAEEAQVRSQQSMHRHSNNSTKPAASSAATPDASLTAAGATAAATAVSASVAAGGTLHHRQVVHVRQATAASDVELGRGSCASSAAGSSSSDPPPRGTATAAAASAATGAGGSAGSITVRCDGHAEAPRCRHGHSHDGHGEEACGDDDGNNDLQLPPDAPPAVVAMVQAEGCHHHSGLKRLSLLSALAVGLHNLPEGLATFVGTIADPRAGVAIAVAIALHNIPEGIVVAMPIYYATGSHWRGFFWSTVSGISEILGAVLGYVILRGSAHDPPLMYAMIFGIVAGMMVYISLQELIPTALQYDPANRYTTRFAMLGMAIMAASLILFQI